MKIREKGCHKKTEKPETNVQGGLLVVEVHLVAVVKMKVVVLN